MQSEWTIGRNPECDIVVSDSNVSGRHCRLFRADQQWMLEDLGSSNGTFVNGTEITSPVAVSTTDKVLLGPNGQFQWPAAMGPRKPSAAISAGETVRPPTLSFRSQEMIIGRDPSCDYVFDHPMVSRRHARLTQTHASVKVEDLGSSNGTFVNGKLLTGPTPISVGDVVSLGSYELRLTGQGLLEQSDLRGKVSIETRSIRVQAAGRTLIDNVSLTIQPGEFVGLMGPSGAGKTTLMNAMNGYLKPSAGEVLFNGESLYGNYSRFAIRMGYLPQDDIIHGDLTVGEALYYTAKLRLPDDYSSSEIENRIKKVLEQMGLSSVRDVLIGSPEKKGISGGQRKRVNLAMELLTEPLVLFLDEPTSGLSSEDALMVMKVLRTLADSGMTILLTIHQPSLEVFRLLDNLTIMSKDLGSSQPGQLAYYGPAYPGAVKFFNPHRTWPEGIEPSPDEILRGLGKKSTQEWVNLFQRSDTCRSYLLSQAKSISEALESAPAIEGKTRGGGTFSQWMTLVRRCLLIKKRDTWNTLILLAQAPVVAFLIVLTFGERASQDATESLTIWAEVANAIPVVLFVLALSGLWFGCSNSVREIVGEWAIYRRERMVNLRIPAYVASKFTVLGLLTASQDLVLLAIVYYGCGLKGSPVNHYISLLLVSLVGVGVGLAVSAGSRTSEAAVAMVPLVLLPMVMLAGAMMPIREMRELAQPIAHMMPSSWAFGALLETENAEQPHAPPAPASPLAPNSGKSDAAKSDQDMAERFFPIDKERIGTVKAQQVLATILFGLITAVHFILWKRDLH